MLLYLSHKMSFLAFIQYGGTCELHHMPSVLSLFITNIKMLPKPPFFFLIFKHYFYCVLSTHAILTDPTGTKSYLHSSQIANITILIRCRSRLFHCVFSITLKLSFLQLSSQGEILVCRGRRRN